MKKTTADGDDVCCSRLEHLIFRTVVTLAHVAVFRSRRERGRGALQWSRRISFPSFSRSLLLAFCLLSASRISLLLRNKLRRRAMERRRRWCAPNENESVEHKPTKPRNNRIAVSPRPRRCVQQLFRLLCRSQCGDELRLRRTTNFPSTTMHGSRKHGNRGTMPRRRRRGRRHCRVQKGLRHRARGRATMRRKRETTRGRRERGREDCLPSTAAVTSPRCAPLILNNFA